MRGTEQFRFQVCVHDYTYVYTNEDNLFIFRQMSSVQAAVVPDITPAFITINTGLAPVSSLQMAPAHSYSYIFVHSAWPGGGGRHVLEWCRCPGRARTPASWPRRPDPGPGATRTPPAAPTPVSLLKSVPESARVYSARNTKHPGLMVRGGR